MLLTGPLTRIVCVQAWAQGSVIASVCHGPAALVRVKDPASGELLLRGKRVACFTNEEEMAVGMVDAVPFLLEDAVKKAGATHELAKAWCASAKRSPTHMHGASLFALTRGRHTQERARGAR
jgi:putative intracellular protease/amidase